MEKFHSMATELPGVVLVRPTAFRDGRGFFLESYTRRDFERLGIADEFVQDNHSCSARGVLRGLHYQYPHAQGKLVRVVRGRIFDAVADIRKGSPSYGRSIGVHLAAEDPGMLWVPPGFAHGFLSLEDHTEVLYKTTDYYYPEHDGGIRWNDPALGIPWPLPAPVLSPKDAALPFLNDAGSPFQYRGEGP
jgi:dTDP-4-dehydrorhamnose 3,5-epimerase